MPTKKFCYNRKQKNHEAKAQRGTAIFQNMGKTMKYFFQSFIDVY